ncbi:MAG: cytochrome d ubiquinol oxidase subunit II [Gemmatimonadales bacterium]|jgi:cytochrome d ubiquinol oxidase subunit II
MSTLQTVWFILFTVLIAGYAVLDGFDLGVGVLHGFAKNDDERRRHLNAVGPVWDGNEVWLLTAGGALFAAFPIVYATVFSGFYLALMLVVAALVFRATSFEFRGKVDTPRWRSFWDWSFVLGSLVASLLFGVAVGNIARGIPIDADGRFVGSFLGLLNPFALLVGLVTLSAFVMHGAAYLLLKVEGDHRDRMRRWVRGSWLTFVGLYAAANGWALAALPHGFDGIATNPLIWLFGAALIVSIVTVPLAAQRQRDGLTFLGSAGTILAMIALPAIGLFPRLVPSSIDLAYSLTAYNASSSQRTLTVMLYIALIGMPLVLVYTAYVYRVFKGKVVLTEESY